MNANARAFVISDSTSPEAEAQKRKTGKGTKWRWANVGDTTADLLAKGPSTDCLIECYETTNPTNCALQWWMKLEQIMLW